MRCRLILLITEHPIQQGIRKGGVRHFCDGRTRTRTDGRTDRMAYSRQLDIASIVSIANIVKFQILPILCSIKIVNRLSSGEKLGVLSQGPTIVYDVKMVGLKVNLEMQDIEIH